MPRYTFVVLMAVAVPACGGSPSAPAQTPAAVQTTDTYSGTTVQSGPGSCSGDSHNFTAQDGAIDVRLVATSDAAGALSVQVCPGGVDTGSNCSIAQQKIAVGQTLTGVRRGIALQNVKLLPHNCVFGGPPSTAPITYTVTVTYMK
jgi:hypothetical protein